MFHGQHFKDVNPESQKERRDSCKERGCISHCFVVGIGSARAAKRESLSSFDLAIDSVEARPTLLSRKGEG